MWWSAIYLFTYFSGTRFNKNVSESNVMKIRLFSSITWHYVSEDHTFPSSASKIHCALKMEAARFLKTLLPTYKIKRRHFLLICNRFSHSLKNFRSQTLTPFSEWMMNDSNVTETLWKWFRKTWVCNKYKLISVNRSSKSFTIFSGFKFRMTGTLTLAWLQSGVPRHTCYDNALIWKGCTVLVG